jgi:hypothetical protein
VHQHLATGSPWARIESPIHQDHPILHLQKHEIRQIVSTGTATTRQGQSGYQHGGAMVHGNSRLEWTRSRLAPPSVRVCRDR